MLLVGNGVRFISGVVIDDAVEGVDDEPEPELGVVLPLLRRDAKNERSLSF